MTIFPIHGLPAYWLHAPPEDADAVLRVAPSLIDAGRGLLFLPLSRLLRPHDPLGDPQDHRVLVVPPAVLARDDPQVPAPFQAVLGLDLTPRDADAPWPAPDPRVRWWIVTPADWPDAQRAASTARVRLVATGPVPAPGPYWDPTDPAWTLGDWLANEAAAPFALDLEEV